MKRTTLAFTVTELLAAIVIIGLLIAVLLPAIRTPREAARRNSCQNNLKQIGLALHHYHDQHGSFPPAYTVDDEGNRLHSWRTLILPYMEETQLYESIDLTKPWDDLANARAREQVVKAYLCPSVPYEEEVQTTYLAVVGPNYAFAGSEPRALADIADGSSETIAIIDVPSKQAVHWMSPQDVTEEEVTAYGPDSQFHHPGSFQATFVDGHGKNLPTDIDKEVFLAMLTIAGGESIADLVAAKTPMQ